MINIKIRQVALVQWY